MSSIRRFVSQSRRILSLATKPSRHEVWLTTKVCALGLILIGVLAFVIHLIFIVIGFYPFSQSTTAASTAQAILALA
jgi:protein translocase SEC61 complex gamma subunit